MSPLVGSGLALLAVNALLWAWLWLVPTLVLRVQRLPHGALGVALPGVVLLAPRVGEWVLRHELVHQEQLRRWSPLGAALAVGGWYLVGILRARRADRATLVGLYRANPLEREAFERMHEQGPLPRHWVLGR